MQGAYFGDRQHSGQGAAVRQIGPTKVLVVTVVNAAGTIVDRLGNVLRCSHPSGDGGCGSIAATLEQHLAKVGVSRVSGLTLPSGDGPTANTTLTVVVTNQTMPFSALQRLAVQVHNSMARAIQPFGMMVDGDTLFAVSTGEVTNSAVNSLDLSTLASETAWDAVLSSAPAEDAATSSHAAADEGVPVPVTQNAYAGRYEFTPGVEAELRRRGDAFEIEVTGRDSLYIPAGTPIRLTPNGPAGFVLATARADRLKVDGDAHGRVVGITLNPGAWPIHARRISK